MDDGKSTLIGRLLHDTKAIYDDQLLAVARDSVRFGTTGAGAIDLALLTDGLKAEREQGITIDVAYRYFATDRRAFIIADTPGHEQYTRNMVTGASTCRVAIVLVDARRGVVTQTRRHSFIASLLGIRHVVVAVNKMDLVGYAQDVFEQIRRDYAAFAGGLQLADVTFIPMSALQGDNVVTKSAAMPWYVGPPLLTHLETVPIAQDGDSGRLRFPVQYVIRPNLDFRGFAGTIASGVLRTGDDVVALPSGLRSRVKSIVTYEREHDEAFAPMAVTVTLDDEIDVSRGDMLVHPGHGLCISNRVDAMVVWMADTPLTPGRSYWIKHTTRTLPGRIAVLRYGVDVNTLEKRPAPRLAMNEVGHVTLALDQPIAFDPYGTNPGTGAFIVIDRLTNNTVGAGMLLPPADGWAGDDGAAHEPRSGEPVSVSEREARLGQKGATVVLLGLDAPDMARLAQVLERRLFDAGRAVTLLGDAVLRRGLCRDADGGAAESLGRAAEVARILNDAGLLCVYAVAAPPEAVQQTVTRVVGADRCVAVALTDLSGPIEGRVSRIVELLRARRVID